MGGLSGYGVLVNEIRIFASATRPVADWWSEQIMRMDVSGVAEPIGLTPCGGMWWLRCRDREEAEFVRGQLIQRGIHPKAAEIKPRRPARRMLEEAERL